MYAGLSIRLSASNLNFCLYICLLFSVFLQSICFCLFLCLFFLATKTNKLFIQLCISSYVVLQMQPVAFATGSILCVHVCKCKRACVSRDYVRVRVRACKHVGDVCCLRVMRT